MYKKLIELGVTVALIVLAVIAISFMGIWTSVIALSTYALGIFIGKYVTEPKVIEKIVEKIVEVPKKTTKKKNTKKVE